MTAQAFNILNSTVSQLALSRFKEPTEIQKLVIPRILNDENVLVIAGTGVGKCISGDSLVFMNNCLQRADVLTKGKVNSLNLKNSSVELNDGFLVKKDNNPILEVTTRHGYSIKSTYDHKFLTINGWKEAKKLTENDFVATARMWKIESENLPDLNLELNSPYAKIKKLNIKFNKNLAYFVGAFIGDGSYNKEYTTRFTNKSTKIIKRVKIALKDLGLELTKSKKEDNEYYVCCKLLRNFLEQMGAPNIKTGKKGGKSGSVYIPNLFLKANKNILASLIAGLYDTDGWIEDTGIFISSKSEMLIKTLQFALLSFGIISIKKIRYKKYKYEKRKYSELRIFDRNSINIFYKNIKLYHESKAIKIRNLSRNFKNENPNIDVIPIPKDIFINIRKAYNIKPETSIYNNLKSYTNSNKHPTRKTLNKIILELEKIKCSKSLEVLKNLSNNDILWDRVVSIKKGNGEIVYDFTVPKTNNFIAEGFILHNTESSMLPLFSKLMDRKDKPISLLYITPMKSLNRDLFDRLVWWCNQLELDISVRHGDTTSHERSLQVEHPPHILITTPEQIQGMLTGKRMQEHLKNIKYIVIDELHELISKRGVQLTIGIQRLKKLCGDPQIIALSATVGSPKVAAEFIFGGKDYEIVKAISEKNIDLKVECPSPTAEDKLLAEKIFIGDTVAARLRRILEIIRSSKSVLTFTNTREAAEVLSSRLRMIDSELAHEVHHSSLSKDVRMQAETNFKEEKLKTLICTSSLELGIDIGTIDVVIQYMSPRQASKLVQRIGRSGHRLGLTSKGYIITNDEDDAFESVVVARKAMHGELEPLKIYKKPLDVLAHQIIGLTVVDYEYKIKDAYKLIKQASPYKDLTEDEFNRTINMLEQIGMLYKDGDKIKRKRRAFEYYFENLSTIPDNKTYKVIDMTANSFVGTLDENFVIEHGEADSTFIVKGRPWRVVSVEEGKIYVEPTDAIESSVPAWEGELIPVPFDVAQEVGEVRRKIAQSLEKDEDAEAELMKKYPLDSQTAKKMIGLVKEQMKKFPVADDRTIVYDKYKEYVVINSCFGSKVNETLARYISALLAAEYGSVIQTKTDPYRIIFKDVDVEDIKKIIKEFHSEDLEFVLNKAMSKSSIFRGRFMNVAKRFGVMSRRSEFGKINLDRLIDTYWKSPVFDETMNELFLEKLDTEKTIEIFDKLNSGKIKQLEADGLSPIGSLGFRNELRDVARPDRPEAEIFKIFKERLLGTKTRIVCMSCGEYSQAGYVKNMPEEPRCTKCSSKLIGVTRYSDTEMQKIVKKRVDGKELTGEEQKKWEGVYQTSNLVIVYGKKAIFVLAGRGVGPVNATRILAKPNLTEEELLKNILTEERNFVKNKKYWS